MLNRRLITPLRTRLTLTSRSLLVIHARGRRRRRDSSIILRRRRGRRPRSLLGWLMRTMSTCNSRKVMRRRMHALNPASSIFLLESRRWRRHHARRLVLLLLLRSITRELASTGTRLRAVPRRWEWRLGVRRRRCVRGHHVRCPTRYTTSVESSHVLSVLKLTSQKWWPGSENEDDILVV